LPDLRGHITRLSLTFPVLYFAAYVAAGLFVGFLSGLLGIGGGMTLVPILSGMFKSQALSDSHIVHLALATSMASIVFTSGSSVYAHHKLGNVRWEVVKAMVPGMLFGTGLATAGSAWVPQKPLAMMFCAIVYGGALQMLLSKKPAPNGSMPAKGKLFAIGSVIGVICGLVSAGGAFLVVPLMLRWGVQLKHAIASAAAVGIPTALVGTVGWVVSGMLVKDLPPWSFGFVYLPALLAIVCASMSVAKYGARMADRLPVATLKKIFALFLFVLATRMLVAFW
jgi:uncharacterized protein